MSSVVTYIIFGTLCVINPKIGPDWHCMNFWQEPTVAHETLDKCEKTAIKMSEDIKKTFKKQEISIVKLDISCINTKTQKLEKSLKTKYNIL